MAANASVPTAETSACTARLHRTYNARIHLGCICPTAKEAAKRYYKRQRCGLLPPRMTDGTGTRRRVQGLACGGFTARQIAVTAGRSHVRVKLLYLPDHTREVTIEVAQAIRSAVGILGRQPAPRGTYATRVRRYAEKAGWWPLDAWNCIDTDPEPSTVDEITVMHAVAGYLRWDQLTEQDQRLVVQDLTGRDWSDVRIAEWLATNHSRIARARNRLEIPAVPSLGRRTA